VRIAAVLDGGATLGYARAWPARAIAVGELLHEIADEPDSYAAISAITLAYTRLALKTNDEVERLLRLIGECVVVPLRSEDALDLADTASVLGGNITEWTRATNTNFSLSSAHDVLIADTEDALLLTPVGDFFRSRFPGLGVLDLPTGQD
jgi:hypothetical protein